MDPLSLATSIQTTTTTNISFFFLPSCSLTSHNHRHFPMSSSPTTTVHGEPDRRTYWCHECDMSLSLLSPTSSVSSPLVCPQCDLDFLERMDDESSPTLFDVTIGDGEQDDHDDDDDEEEDWCFVDPTVNSDDNFLLDSPYLHRLLRHLASENSGSSSSSSSSSSAASSLLKSSDIDSIPTIQISSSMLCSDPDPDSVLLCAVCKEDFTVGNPLRDCRAVTSTTPIASSLGYRITTRARSVDSSSPRRRKRKPSVVVARTLGSDCPIWLRSSTETRRKTIGSESETRSDGSLVVTSR
ncbi:hypothetical protein Bca52824_077999 [Brassica carinata]|uniref:RING-type E3 ubiquitin transferase n=1 Tax=Brassica carinata TaxID=52824 RepID=A0A8X7TXT2_BRACI|nr:hypothetical protein Bca52824_077999 [Brassica carinata]